MLGAAAPPRGWRAARSGARVAGQCGGAAGTGRPRDAAGAELGRDELRGSALGHDPACLQLRPGAPQDRCRSAFGGHLRAGRYQRAGQGVRRDRSCQRRRGERLRRGCGAGTLLGAARDTWAGHPVIVVASAGPGPGKSRRGALRTGGVWGQPHDVSGARRGRPGGAEGSGAGSAPAAGRGSRVPLCASPPATCAGAFRGAPGQPCPGCWWRRAKPQRVYAEGLNSPCVLKCWTSHSHPSSFVRSR